MYGQSIGVLRIKVNGVTKLTRNNNYGNRWFADAVDISGTNAMVAKQFSNLSHLSMKAILFPVCVNVPQSPLFFKFS